LAVLETIVESAWERSVSRGRHGGECSESMLSCKTYHGCDVCGVGWWEGERCVKVRREDVKWEDGEWQRQAAGERRMLYRAEICE
jgi:hypothetical protein